MPRVFYDIFFISDKECDATGNSHLTFQREGDILITLLLYNFFTFFTYINHAKILLKKIYTYLSLLFKFILFGKLCISLWAFDVLLFFLVRKYSNYFVFHLY